MGARRVKISLDPGTGGAGMPFLVGVLADLGGAAERPPFRDRDFVEVDRRDVDRLMARIAPRVGCRVEDTLTGRGEMFVELGFRALADFDPARIAVQVPALRELLEERRRLLELRDGIDRLSDSEYEVLLSEVLQDDRRGGSSAQALA